MGLLDPLRRLFASNGDGDGEGDGDGVGERTGSAAVERTVGPTDDVEFGPLARSYLETGAPPEGTPNPEREGRVSVLVTSSREPGPEGLIDTDEIEARVAALDGEVEHAHGGGTVSAWVPPKTIEELADGPDVARVEVTIPDDGGVREDPAFEA